MEEEIKSICKKAALIGSPILLALLTWIFFVGHNNDQNYQVRQSVGGNITIQDRGGYYFHTFNTIWTYPRAINDEYKAPENEVATSERDETLKCEGESIRITFNDGGNACIDTVVRYRLPSSVEVRKVLHREFSGNVDSISTAVFAHLTNVAKATAPLMSASEHQSARKGEFTELVNQQLKKGLFRMKRIKKELADRKDENGKPITVEATELIVNKDGMPIISEPSPLIQYEIEVLQFSVGETEYDKQTLKNFKVKKDSFLRAENMKSQREAEVQQRLMVVEKGLREKAEVEALANKEKAQAVINAEREKEVAETNAARKVAVEKQAKLEAETKAQKLLEVAKIEKAQAETVARQKLEVAKLNAKAAAKQAEAIRVLAKAEEERIKKAGAITEQEKVLAEITAMRDAKVAAELAKIKVPQFVITGASGGAEGSNEGMTSTLMNMFLLDKLSVTDKVGTPISKTVNKAMTK